MRSPLKIAGESLTRGLAVLVVIGQLLGTIGIVPVRANPDEVDPNPYPCKDHPCGCRTATQCWAGACCCFTMQEKVAWAEQNGITPPVHAVDLAREEAKETARKKASQPILKKSCCSHAIVAHECEDGFDESKSESMPDCCTSKHQKTNGINWVAGFYAQQCHGDGFAGLGLLNIGVPPSFPEPLIMDPVFVAASDTTTRMPAPVPSRPLLPPPKC